MGIQNISDWVMEQTGTEYECIQTALNAKASKVGVHTYLKTPEAWLRRVSCLKMADLEFLCNSLDSSSSGENATTTRQHQDVINVQGLNDIADPLITLEECNDTVSHVSDHADEMERKSVCGADSKECGSVVSTYSEARENKSEGPPLLQEHPPVSQPECGGNDDDADDADGTTSCSTRVEEDLRFKEDQIRVLFTTAIKTLERNYKEGKYREEQYRRKRAELKSKYWSDLDKLRNNASRTTICGE